VEYAIAFRYFQNGVDAQPVCPHSYECITSLANWTQIRQIHVSVEGVLTFWVARPQQVHFYPYSQPPLEESQLGNDKMTPYLVHLHGEWKGPSIRRSVSFKKARVSSA
jgi:hypothetical protein